MGEVVGLNLTAVYQTAQSLGYDPEHSRENVDKVIALHNVFFPPKKKESDGQPEQPSR